MEMITETISVFQSVSAAFDASSTDICIPEQVTYTSQSPNATSYEWTFEGGTPANSTEENPVISYDEPGVYNVTLLVSIQ